MIIPVIAGSYQEFLYWRKGQPVDDYRYIPVNTINPLRGTRFTEIKKIGTYLDRWSLDTLRELELLEINISSRYK